MKDFKVTEWVDPKSIWDVDENHTMMDHVPGLVRGYNVEVAKPDGTTGWWSCTWIEEDIEDYVNSEFFVWMMDEVYGYTPTGRVSFRGYGIEEYDIHERETYIRTIDIDEYIRTTHKDSIKY